MAVIKHYYMACDTYWIEDTDATDVDKIIEKLEWSERTKYLTKEETSWNEYYVFLSETSEGIRVPEKGWLPNSENVYCPPIYPKTT